MNRQPVYSITGFGMSFASGMPHAAFLSMRDAKCTNVLAWIKMGHEAPVPRFCELEVSTKGSFLIFQIKAGEPKHHQRIERRLLRKVVVGQIQEADYIYHPPLKLRGGW